MINFVSPPYIKAHGESTKVEELAEHFIIHYATALGTRSATWKYFDGEKYTALKMNSLNSLKIKLTSVVISIYKHRLDYLLNVVVAKPC